MKRSRVLLLGLLLLCVAGCGTISDMTQGSGGQRIFGGIRHDAEMIQGPSSTGSALGLIDFLFSLPLDIGLLPVTLIVALFR